MGPGRGVQRALGVGYHLLFVDTAVYAGPLDSLKTLFEPPAELQGKIGMFGSPSEVMSLALVYLGKPQCNTDPG